MKPTLMFVATCCSLMVISTIELSVASGDDLPSVHYPAKWGLGVGTLPQYSFSKVSERIKVMDQGFLQRELPRWQQAFKGAVGTEVKSFEVLMFVVQVDSLWEKGKFQAARASTYSGRIPLPPAQTIRSWQVALDAVAKPGDSVSLPETLAYLIQSERLFADGNFDSERADVLFARLRSLDSTTIKAWRDAAGLYTSQAAMSLIELDSIFDDQHRFLGDSFEKTFDALKSASKKAPKRPSKK